MKIVTWNVNGLRACMNYDGFQAVHALAPDVICCQETRTEEPFPVLEGYYHYWNPGQRPGYSGTLVMSKEKPYHVIDKIGKGNFDEEGRVLAIELLKCYVVNVYVPNSQKNLRRKQYRLCWDKALREFIAELAFEKPVILCGDMNAPMEEIDVYPENLREMENLQGYAEDERANMLTLLEAGYVDAYRYLHPTQEGVYSWWSNRRRKRDENRGWRLDYFFVDEQIKEQIIEVTYHSEVYGSDHCPVELEIKL